MKWNKIIAFTEGKKQVGSIEAAVNNNVAYFNIVGRIWSWSADQESILRREVENSIAAGVKDAIIEGSSEGGSVFATNDMKALFDKYDTVQIKVHALMASAFTYLTSHYHTTVKANTQGMIHMPILSVKGNVKEVRSTLKLGENITEDYAKAYANKTGKTVKQIKALWDSGDYWMNADELLKEGFVDAIEGEVEAFTDTDVMSLVACGAPIIPEVQSETQGKTEHKSKTNIMDKDELIAFLGLDSNATDEQIEAAKRAMKVDALKQRSQAEADKDKAETEANTKVEALVNKGISEKKFSADEAPHYTDLAKANFDATEKVIAAMPSKEKLSAQLKGEESTTGSASVKANWTLEDYLDNDPEAYEKLKAEKPKEAEALEAAYFSKQ
ncbi:ATP-dependent Clp protease proteolytic subunit [Formosa agariphila]|uniref:ATP-dependent Clp protease proteolytic subunit n=1 Tax=Formosa agariphila TaxID=320324 RepID=UPI00056F18B6|nr:ATP-dependent Clp protease proteolytic subunit [Formosa agariphila]